jgi:hypothetical protein
MQTHQAVRDTARTARHGGDGAARSGRSLLARPNALRPPLLTVGRRQDQLEWQARRIANLHSDKSVGSEGGSLAHIRPSADRGGVVPDDVAHRIQNLRGAGREIPESFRTGTEARLGHDIRNVRIHSGAEAELINAELGTRAVTLGKDIFFGRGQTDFNTPDGQRLLVHEVVHTIQQGDSGRILQADFAIEPTTPRRAVRTLSAAEIQAAITFNQARHTDAVEIALIRDIIGISKAPAVIDEDFVQAVVRYQARYGLGMDGRLGHDTADRLAKEIIAEAQMAGPLGSLAPEFSLTPAIRALINANNKTYADYKAAIQGATMIQQHVTLQDQQLLTDLKAQLSWNNWARCIELLGRRAPTGAEMLQDATVRAALAAAFTASNPAVTIWPTHDPAQVGNACNPPPAGAPPTTAHEEGGFIYLNLITGELSTRRVAAGAQAALTLTAPAVVADSIVVGGFHTHPNVGACWGAPFFSGADTAWATANAVPLLMRGAFPAVANTSDHATGDARAHLAGPRGLPGVGGALAPQSPLDADYDEL